MKIAIIGGGNMGEAFARGIKQHFEKGDFELIVSEKNIDKHLAFHSLQIRTTTSNVEAVGGVDVIVLAVKPVDMEETCRALAEHLGDETIVISIAAGVKLASLESWLGTARVVRVMPNLLASIGRSVTVWYTQMKDDTSKKLVQKILESIGSATELDDEISIDMASTICGCGPAYIWYFMEKIMAAGEEIGLDPRVAKMLTVETFRGTAATAMNEDFDPKTMRLKVTSKAGVTEQAIGVFDERDLGGVIEEALAAALKRSIEMGGV